jgi:hypothetical protein
MPKLLSDEALSAPSAAGVSAPAGVARRQTLRRNDTVYEMKTVIAGLGKTGTTALFFKIKQSLPADTLCLFEPKAFEAAPGHTGPVLAKVLIGLNRTTDIASFRTFDRKIILVRDPRDTLVSRVMYDIYNEPALCADDAKVNAFVNLVRRKEADPARTPIKAIVDLFDDMSHRAVLPRATEDPGVALEFQRRRPDFIRYRYEHLVIGDFTTLDPYLGLTLNPGAASVPSEYGRVTRTKGCGDWRNWLTASDVDFFRPFFSPYMTLNGYPDDWTLPDRPHIRPQHGSGYVLRLVEERRRLSS